MLATLSLPFLFLASPSVAAGVYKVTIGLHNTLDSTGSACNTAPAFTCETINFNDCCQDGRTYFAATFNGLPTTGNPIGEGIAYMGGGCGTSCNSGYGADLCVGCKARGSSFVITGANWAEIRPGRHRRNLQRDTSADCNPVLPDAAVIGGHKFSINYDVPRNVTERLSDLALTVPRLNYEDVPEDLLAYEMVVGVWDHQN